MREVTHNPDTEKIISLDFYAFRKCVLDQETHLEDGLSVSSEEKLHIFQSHMLPLLRTNTDARCALTHRNKRKEM